MAREQIEFPIGELLPGTKYKVVRKLGQGGMGVVLEVGKEPGLRAVVKIIHPALAAKEDFRRRFFDEVRILAKLEHPNIVRVMDYDTLADGTPYFVMEYLKGNTVHHALRSVGNVQPINLYLIMRGLMEGLEYAHSHDPPIIHRDIKAENIFIHAPTFGEPCVKIIDFGVAGGDSIVEARGTFVGTPRFAAPEQLRGARATPKADLYSAALVLYQGLAGRGPFDDVALVPDDGGDRQKAFVRAHLTLPPPSVRVYAPWVPAQIDTLLQSALSKNPDERPESAYAFAAQLYMLQFANASPLSVNTTAPTLVTMVTATPSSFAPGDLPPPDPQGTPTEAPATRALPKGRSLQDTWVEPVRSLASFAEGGDDSGEGAEGGTPFEDAGNREAARLVEGKETMPLASLTPARPTGPRSFAEAELARGRSSRGAAEMPIGLAASMAAASSEAGTSRSEPVIPNATPSGRRVGRGILSFLAFGLGIPLLTLAVLVAVDASKAKPNVRAAGPPSASPAPTRPLTPLPPEDPVASWPVASVLPPTSRGASQPAVTVTKPPTAAPPRRRPVTAPVAPKPDLAPFPLFDAPERGL